VPNPKKQDTDVVPCPDRKEVPDNKNSQEETFGKGIESEEPPLSEVTASSDQPETPNRPTQELIDEGRRLKKERLKRAKVQERVAKAIQLRDEALPPSGRRTPQEVGLAKLHLTFLKDKFPDREIRSLEEDETPKLGRYSHRFGFDANRSYAEMQGFADDHKDFVRQANFLFALDDDYQ